MKEILMNQKSSIARKERVLLACLVGLGQAITSNMREVWVDWEERSITLYFVFDGEISEDDENEVDSVAFEVSCSFPNDHIVEAKCIRIDFPASVGNIAKACIYARKE
jgi:hypothetical protein